MQTRTELILLQRTMVVVEELARSLDSHINIWQVAKYRQYMSAGIWVRRRLCAIWARLSVSLAGLGRSCR